MRDLKDFSPREWLRLLPLQLAFKQLRNDAWLMLYKRLRPGGLPAFLEKIEPLKGRNIALVIAFEQPWALDWLLRMAKLHLTDTTVLVFDNSRRATARQEIEKVCSNHSAPYLPLPANPTRHVNRSHGMAMTWVFRNVVQAIKPSLFAFIDHDMIPVQKIEFAQRLGRQPFFGFRRSSKGQSWNLWAGYCVYDFSQVANTTLNFLYDFSRGLDTGGRNWKRLYRHHDPASMNFAESRNLEVRDPVTGEQYMAQVIDDCWFHIGGIGYNDNFRAKFDCCKNLAQAFEQGMNWQQIRIDRQGQN